MPETQAIIINTEPLIALVAGLAGLEDLRLHTKTTGPKIMKPRICMFVFSLIFCFWFTHPSSLSPVFSLSTMFSSSALSLPRLPSETSIFFCFTGVAPEDGTGGEFHRGLPRRSLGEGRSFVFEP